jgi:hypothetical protein
MRSVCEPVIASDARLWLSLAAGAAKVRSGGKGPLRVAAEHHSAGQPAALPGVQHRTAERQATAHRHVSDLVLALVP